MDKRISELFDYGDEIAVELRADADCDPAEIKEMTMKRVHEEGIAPIEIKTVVKKTRPARRTLLIAAAVAAILSAAAFAAYQLGLKDLMLGIQDDDVTYISVVGWRDTPEYRAFAEWNDYLRDYDATPHEVPDVKNDGSIPVEYLRLGAYNDPLMDALDDILEKYDLHMHDGGTVNLPAEGSGVDLDAILLGDVQGAGGYAYGDGTMMLEVMQTLSDGETAEYQLFSAVKGTFTMISGGIDSEYEEWTHTAADGTEVNLVLGERSSLIVADLENTFVTVNTVFRSVSGKEALEELADSLSWKTLDECPHFTPEYYAAYRADVDARNEEGRLAWEARSELDGMDWTLTEDILRTHEPEVRGRSSDASGDGSAWLEWVYTPLEGEGTIRLRYERPAGDIETAFDAALAESGLTDAEQTIENVAVYVRTETDAGADYVTERRDFPVYFGKNPDGGWCALWLDEAKYLIFTLAADPGELTEDELTAEIAALLGGREPYPMAVAPSVVWDHLGRWEPDWLPEGWYLDPETPSASAMTVDGVWSGRTDQAYVDGSVGHILWFSYASAPEGAAPRSVLEAAYIFTEEELEAAGVTLTDTAVNGHPALLREAYRSADLTWIDEAAGVLFTVSGDDAETVRTLAESVAAQ